MNNKTKVRAAARDFVNSEYTARNNVKNVFSATKELELVEYFKQAATLQ
jgi:hypothetical protein